MDCRIYLKVKLKSLAEEARIIRAETNKAKLPSIKDGLASHRRGIVRYEARHTLLAYGFLRGRSYRQLEQKAKEAPNWAKVRKMVEKYGSHFAPELHEGNWSKAYDAAREDKQQALRRLDEWIKEAKTVCS